MNKEKLEVLVTLDEYLGKLEYGIELIISKIEEGKEREACTIIANAAEGIEWVLSAVELTVDIHGGRLSIDNLENHIEEVVQGLEGEDYVFVGDLFNYEILPTIENLHKNIKAFIE